MTAALFPLTFTSCQLSLRSFDFLVEDFGQELSGGVYFSEQSPEGIGQSFLPLLEFGYFLILQLQQFLALLQLQLLGNRKQEGGR